MPMPLYIKDQVTTDAVTELARLRGLTKQAAVRMAVESELRRLPRQDQLRDRFAALRAEHPLPPPTGLVADKAFFDALSGEPE
jgi:antitoxin VapB